ncbi:triose-phosphate isomerase [Leucobacter sp. G161]|uniref:triose-phosphate isomerase n=1 Tax=Leucobacter sp. G161 TaxID=663704 RepID=UPI00073CB077|nr:triose-phosphate isomerase [Leucobacter sp. G161]KUF07620.1 triose-phosphate isomerase [Leucobacter sp. G161]
MNDAATQPAPPQAPPVKRTPLIAGNWKMNFDHLQAIAFVQKLAWSLKDAQHNYGEVEVAVFPPFTDLRSVQTLLSADKLPVALGAQDVSPHESGAYTGDVSASMLKKLDTRYIIVGHSERRGGHGENDETVGLKARAAANAGMVPVICVGETAADLEEHGAAAIPVQQLTAALTHLAADAEIVIAYEPVWAIGSGDPATPEQAEEVGRALREVLRAERGDAVADRTRILYGGSGASQNVASYMKQPNLDGALVGGASLKVDEFSRIAQFTKHVTV